MTANLIPPDIARRIRSEFQRRQDSIESFIKTLVELESPSGDPDRSKALVDVLVSAAEQLRCVNKVERVEVPGFGQNVVIEAFQQQQSNGQILLVGHTDTVHEVGSIMLRPFRRQDKRLYGPGTFDMKASCAMAIEVLRTLEELDITPQFGVTIVLTCDEEVGSQSGWPLIERVARSRKHSMCFSHGTASSRRSCENGQKGNWHVLDQG
jgi:glutamate carboxypeptidase